MFMPFLFMLTNGHRIVEQHCIYVNTSFCHFAKKILYENMQTPEQFSSWIQHLQKVSKIKRMDLNWNNERTEIMYCPVTELNTPSSFAEKVVYQNIQELSELKQIEEHQTMILRGLVFNADLKQWLSLQYTHREGLDLNVIAPPFHSQISLI